LGEFRFAFDTPSNIFGSTQVFLNSQNVQV
jgi:hypothetical protein